MKTKLLILATILSVITLYFIVDSYAIYESDVTVPTESNLAAWKINVNDESITGEASTFFVDMVNWETSTNVLEGRAAPSLGANFNIIIDPTGTDVSVRYDMTLDFDSIDNEEFKLVSVTEVNGTSLIRTGKYTYSAVLLLEDIKKGITNDIKVNINWYNNEANNEVDSQFSKPPNDIDSQFSNPGNVVIRIPVSIKFSQYFGEEITEYIE